MNKANILAVADAIERHTIPELGFNMGDFIHQADNKHYTDKSGHGCGTVACIAGWTKRVRTGAPVVPEWTDDFDWETEAEWLGIDASLDWDTTSTARQLFYGGGLQGSLFSVTPARAAMVLRHLAETGKVDWSIGAEATNA